ncbi:MAG: hypothetical protein AB9917_05660 [Negativicutes bacterium]
MHQKLDPAHFREPTNSQFGGLPLLLVLWNQLDFSILLTQCGIFKVRGLVTWKLAFAFVASMICHCSSDLKRLEFWNQDALLQTSLKVSVVTQSVLSRFLNFFPQWPAFNWSRVQQLQTDPQYALADGDVIGLDDTLIPHQYAKKLPFLCKLFDHSLKTYVMASIFLPPTPSNKMAASILSFIPSGTNLTRKKLPSRNSIWHCSS